MIFETLHIQNFMSIRTADIPLNDRGMVLITGENKDNPNFDNNGAGKSTIIEALSYVLYGRTIRGLKGDEVVNRTVNRNCRVMIDIIDDDGTKYRVTRYRKHNEHKNKFFLYKGTTDITPKSEADFTKAVSDLLQMDYLSFTSSVLYSAQSFKFSTSTDAEMKSAFDSMLGFDLFTKYQDATKLELKDKNSEISSKETEKEQLIFRCNAEQSNMETFTTMSDDFEENTQNQIKDLEDERKQLDKQSAELSETNDRETAIIDDFKAQLIELDGKITAAKKSSSKVQKLRDGIQGCQEDLNDCDDKITLLERRKNRAEVAKKSAENDLSKLSKKQDKINDEIDKIRDRIGTPCPTCGRPLDEEHIQSAIDAKTAELDEINEESITLTQEIDQSNEDIAKYNKKSEEVEAEKAEIQADMDTLQAALDKESNAAKKSDELHEDYKHVQGQLRTVEQENASTIREMDKILNKVSTISEKIEELSKAENPYKAQIADAEKKIGDFMDKIHSLNKEITELKSDAELLEFWVNGFSNSGIKSLLLDDITPYLNRRANKYLHKLSSNHMEIIFSTQSELKTGEKREKFNIEIKNADGGNSYLSNSSGERRRIDIAINLALQDLVASRSNKKLNIMFLDEVMDTLDESGVTNVMDLIKDISAGKSSVFVISHNEEIKAMFTNVINVVKENGCSTIEVA